MSEKAFLVKTVRYRGEEVSVIMQDENGPCPLLALANLLLLRGGEERAVVLEAIDKKKGRAPRVAVLAAVAEVVMAKCASDEERQKVVEVLPKLGTGIDVDVWFTRGPRGFGGADGDDEGFVFDVVGAPLVHAWQVDPQDMETFSQMATMSFNQAVMVMTDEEHPKHAFVREWFESSASQMTVYGLVQVAGEIGELELGVFFVNNHFLVITNVGGVLYSLVTDAGYAKCGNDVVWERLNGTDGDSQFFNGEFQEYKPEPKQAEPKGKKRSKKREMTQEEKDYAFALALQEKEKQQIRQERKDHELAKKMSRDGGDCAVM